MYKNKQQEYDSQGRLIRETQQSRLPGGKARSTEYSYSSSSTTVARMHGATPSGSYTYAGDGHGRFDPGQKKTGQAVQLATALGGAVVSAAAGAAIGSVIPIPAAVGQVIGAAAGAGIGFFAERGGQAVASSTDRAMEKRNLKRDAVSAHTREEARQTEQMARFFRPYKDPMGTLADPSSTFDEQFMAMQAIQYGGFPNH